MKPPPAPSNSPSTAGGGADVNSVPGDVIGAHILTRLDGPSLSSSICACSHFRYVAAANEEPLWRNVSISTWPSIRDPRVQSAIASLPRSHRGFFSDCFPLLTGHVSRARNSSRSIVTEELISAVDVYYKRKPIFSRVQLTETVTGWFEHSPFRIDMLGPKESVRVPVPGPGLTPTDLKLSWILIDPARARSVNLSSRRAVAASRRHWLTGEVTVKYSTVVGGERAVEVEMKVTCSAGEMHVREVGMRVEDVEGKWMKGKGSLEILVDLMEAGERKLDKEGSDGRVTYAEYLERKRVWREERESRERKKGMACIIIFILFFLCLWGFLVSFLC